MSEDGKYKPTGNPDWVKGGRSPNPGGRHKQKVMSDALRIALTSDPAKARAISEKLIKMAIDGDLQAASLIFDRLEGKAVQQIEVDTTVHTLSTAERFSRVLELQAKLIGEGTGDDDKPH